MGQPKESRWSGIGTEQRNEKSAELDQQGGEQVVTLLLEEDRVGLGQALARTSEIDRAAQWFAEAYGGGGMVLFAGAGTSGRLGVLEAAECPPTFNSDPERIVAIMAGGPSAVFRSKEGAEDSSEDGAEGAADLGSGDLLVGLSASSVTPYVRGAIDQARDNGARTVLVTCAAPEGLEQAADLVIALNTGAEILTGSTRLKAGSATKAVLNAISTSAMVRLGKVYGNLMVDVQPSCAKLEDRARRIVGEIADVSAEDAQTWLDRSQGSGRVAGSVKLAIVMAKRSLSMDEAEELLKRAKGSLRRALETKR